MLSSPAPMSSMPLSSASITQLGASGHAQLSELIQTKRAIIGVIGLGYVGLPLDSRVHSSRLPVRRF